MAGAARAGARVRAPAARLARVHRTYRAARPVHALRDVSLTLEAGRTTALMGRSGSGKSTLLNILGLLDRQDSGRYFLDGKDVTSASEALRTRLRAAHIGFVFQQFHLLPYRSALQNVELGLQPHRLRQRERVAAALEMLERVGLGDRRDHHPAQLSGGEQQRVAIARALVGDPLLLLCDEPTGNLDSRTAADILDLIQELGPAGRIVVIVTHEPDVARRADVVVEMVDGRITGHRSLP